jgi:hypothetical protein
LTLVHECINMFAIGQMMKFMNRKQTKITNKELRERHEQNEAKI